MLRGTIGRHRQFYSGGTGAAAPASCPVYRGTSGRFAASCPVYRGTSGRFAASCQRARSAGTTSAGTRTLPGGTRVASPPP
jgi:hypothetical protein